MSYTETHIGKVKIHTPIFINGEKATLEQQCKYILESRLKEFPNISFNINAYDSWKEALLDGPFYKQFAIYKNNVVEIIEDKEIQYDDIFYASKMQGEKNIYNFVVQYYNGGCCLSEAVEEALDYAFKKENIENFKNEYEKE